MSIGLTFTLLLWFTPKINRLANRFLALASGTAVLCLTRIFCIDIRLETYFPYWSWLPLQFSLALGPLIYFYVRKTTNTEYKFSPKAKLHFSPLMLQFGANALAINESIKTASATYHTSIFQQLNPILQLLAFISVSVYLYASCKLTKRAYRQLKFNGGDRYRYGHQWLYKLLMGFGLLWLLWIPFIVADHFYYHHQPGTHAYYLLYLLLAAMAIWITAVAYLRPEVNVPTDQASFFKPSTPAELKQKGIWLKKAVKEHRYYRDPELSLSSLAEKLGLTSHEISRIINMVLKKSFNDFINEFRVTDVIRKMQDTGYDHITLLGIALDSGFNSQSTFTRIFKHMTGKSPVEYKNELKKDCPSYNLGSDVRFGAVISYHKTTPKWTQDTKSNRNFMIKNYIKIAWRNMKNNKFFSIINILGLSIGLACCMLIVLYLHYETSYDSYHKNVSNLYQVETEFVVKNVKDSKTPNTPAPLGPALKQDFPEVAESARLLGLFSEDKILLQYNRGGGEKKSFLEENGYLTDPSFFRMFTYNFIEGKPDIALNNPNTIVISEQIAKKMFGNQPALNKVIHITSNTNGEYDFTVTGVFRPLSTPSHINASFFMSFAGGDMERFIKYMGNNFASSNMFYTYVMLKPGADPLKLQNKFSAFIDKYAGKDLKSMGFYKKQFLLPVKDLHLSDELKSNITPPASKTYLYILASIAVFTLLIACINFMNLSTARSSKRSAEVGVRKVLGAEKSALIRQFLGESVLMTIFAFVIAVWITILFLPLFNLVTGKDITISFAQDGWLLGVFLLIALFTGILAGSYPAFYLSSFNPVKVLKGKLTNSLAVVAIRKGLVVFQFVISVVLIIASVVIARQMHYLRTADLGFAKDQQIVIPLRSATSKSIYPALKADIKNNVLVASIGASVYYPGIVNLSDNGFYKDGQTVIDAKRTRLNYVDNAFLNTLDIKLVAGRLFSPEFKSDTDKRIIVNETAIKQIGFASPQKAVGSFLHFSYLGKVINFEIVGVVKDFNYQDLHLPVTPYGFNLLNDNSRGFNYMIVHAKAGNMSQVLKQIANTWHKYDQTDPFEFNFMDEQFQKNYAADDRLAAIVGYFTAIAILISCLGLFGLAAFSAEQRTKEIGVRKVLGASVQTIVSLLSVDFLKLIILSIIIASPIAWWGMNQWLQNFAYHQAIDWTIFAYTAFIALTIGLLTIGSQAIKAALTNPVKSLKAE